MRNIFTILMGLVVLAGCDYTGGILIDPPLYDPIELRLEQNDDGDLEYCDEDGRCSVYPNPDDCAILLAEIDPYTGETCETCTDDDGIVIAESCEGTSIACTVVTAPEPDCVVCAHVGGAVIFSDCVPAEPDNCVYYDDGVPVGPDDWTQACVMDADCPLGMVCDGGLCLPNCRICYDDNGRPVLTDCHTDCGNVGCPTIACEPGFVELIGPGECCPRCVPIESCEEIVCPMDFDLPECPPGSMLVRDPADCCHYYCELQECPPWPPELPTCPPGFVMDFEFPNCGRCVPGGPPVQLCVSSHDCGPEEFCTVEAGECLPPPGCTPGDECLDVCYGACRPRYCPEPPDDPDDPLLVEQCEGEYVPGGAGPDGCPLPPICVCADGLVSYDGTCSDQCALVDCYAPPPDCKEDERFVDEFPYCCGACVPYDACLPGELASDSGVSFGCPQIECAAGFHPEAGMECCDECVRDKEPCSSSSMCHTGEYCTTEQGVCDPPPDDEGGLTVCYGTCAPLATCLDSDGVDPNTAGFIESTSSDDWIVLEDHCDDAGNVVEYWCYPLFEGSDQTAYGQSVMECSEGCTSGACD